MHAQPMETLVVDAAPSAPGGGRKVLFIFVDSRGSAIPDYCNQITFKLKVEPYYAFVYTVQATGVG